MGLPVKLSNSGFYPFVMTYSVCFLAQAVSIIFLCEVMQRGYLYERAKGAYGEVVDSIPLDDMDDVITHEVKPSDNELLARKGDLHSLAKYFLPKIVSKIYDAGVLIHFASIMITYTLAASSAFGDLFGVLGSDKWVFLSIPFVTISAVVVIFAYNTLQPIMSFFTFGKAAMLILMVVITAVVSGKVRIIHWCKLYLQQLLFRQT